MSLTNEISGPTDTAVDPVTIQVVAGCDDRYAPHLCTMLLSLFTHSTSHSVRVHVMVPPNFASRAKLDQVLGDHAGDLTYHLLGEASCPDPAFRSYLSSPTYFRCFVGWVLPPSIRRIIYLDSDMILRRDLIELWEMPLGGNVVGAVLDPAFDRWHFFDMVPDAPYFNAGMMVVDMARWRDEGIGEATLRFATSYPERLMWQEQCALNWTLRGKWLELDPRWNAQFSHFSNENKGGVGYLHPVPPIVADPWIAHFNAPGRPWLYMDNHPFKPEYLSYVAKTPWRDARPVDRHLANVALKPLGWYGLVARRAYWRMCKYVRHLGRRS